jgi:glycine oxidase
MEKRDLPLLIAGQGLAGTVLAWRLWKRGVPFLVADPGDAVTCSKVAAGLVTPVTGMRLNLNWRFDTLWRQALEFYREVEGMLGEVFFHETDQVRLFRDPAQAELFRRRVEDPAVAAWVTQVDWTGGGGLVDGGKFENPYGGFQQTGGGWLDAAGFLRSSRAFFEQRQCIVTARVEERDARPGSRGGVIWRDQNFAAMALCSGWQAASWESLEWLPFQSARGSIVRATGGDWAGERRVINDGRCWLLPRGNNDLRAGPTYEPWFDPAHPHQPDPGKLDELKSRADKLARGRLIWGEAQAAVRPIVRGAKVVLGAHPARPWLLVFNGLGSKGVLRAPWAAAHLLSHWMGECPPDPEADLQRLV